MCTHMRMHIRETYLCRADARSVKVYAQSSAAEQKKRCGRQNMQGAAPSNAPLPALQKRAIERLYIFLCRVFGVTGTAGIVHSRLGEEVDVLLLYYAL